MKAGLKCVKVVEFLWVHEGPVSKKHNTSHQFECCYEITKYVMFTCHLTCLHLGLHAVPHERRSFTLC